MPQGSLLGSLSFLVMIDHLNVSGSDIHKYVDDTTITEIGHSSSTSRMHEYLDISPTLDSGKRYENQ